MEPLVLMEPLVFRALKVPQVRRVLQVQLRFRAKQVPRVRQAYKVKLEPQVLRAYRAKLEPQVHRAYKEPLVQVLQVRRVLQVQLGPMELLGLLVHQ
jgi:hypothetical protein